MPRTATSPRALRAAREQARMTREQAAVAADISLSSVQGYETGRSTPSVRALAALARAYGRTVDDLLSDAPAGTR